MTNESLLAPATYRSTSLVRFAHRPGSLFLSICLDDVRVEGVLSKNASSTILFGGTASPRNAESLSLSRPASRRLHGMCRVSAKRGSPKIAECIISMLPQPGWPTLHWREMLRPYRSFYRKPNLASDHPLMVRNHIRQHENATALSMMQHKQGTPGGVSCDASVGGRAERFGSSPMLAWLTFSGHLLG